jgi:RHS repeat-associated protein
MGYFDRTSCPETAASPSKNRVWSFWDTAANRVGFPASEPVKPHRQTRSMPTKPVSGRPNGNISDYLASNGIVVAHREFDPYGNTTTATGPLVNNFNFWFSSKYLDQETGLYYYGYRFYSPALGRWASRDPIEEQGGLNLHVIVLNDPVNSVDAFGLRTLAEDIEAHALLQAVEAACRLAGRPLTGKFLGLYLNEKNSGEYELTPDEVMTIINNEGFRTSLKKRAWVIIVRNGPGMIRHQDTNWSSHRFYKTRDGDLWSAFNDIRFKVALDGCIEAGGADGLRFHGNMTVDMSDMWTFGNPGTAHRQPFQFWDWLPNRYQYIREQRFLDLETRGWVKPFNIKGRRHAAYTITVNRSSPAGAEMRYDPYNR